MKCMESRKVHGCPIEYSLNEKKKEKFFSLIVCLYLKPRFVLLEPISCEQILLLSILSESQGGCSGFQVTGMIIKWGQKSK